MKVLIAEDDDSCARLLKFVFQKAGYEVEVAHNGNEAWTALQRENSPKLAVLDWMMPGMSGVEVCSKVRASGENIRTYIMLLTAKTHSRDIVDALDAGADDYVTKPFDSKELLARLRVADRTLTLQNQLHHQIDALESLLRRHNLLGEMYRNRGTGLQDEDSNSMEFNHIFAKTLEQMGLSFDLYREENAAGDPGPSWVVWTAMVFKSTSQWYDIMIQVDEDSARILYQRIIGHEAASEQQVGDLLAEILSLAQSRITKLFAHKNIRVLAPFMSRTLSSSLFQAIDLPRYDSKIYGFRADDFVIELEIAKQAIADIRKPLRKLQELDVLTDPIFRPVPKNQILINAGVAINRYHLQKLAGLKLLWLENKEVAVIEPTQLTRALQAAVPIENGVAKPIPATA